MQKCRAPTLTIYLILRRLSELASRLEAHDVYASRLRVHHIARDSRIRVAKCASQRKELAFAAIEKQLLVNTRLKTGPRLFWSTSSPNKVRFGI